MLLMQYRDHHNISSDIFIQKIKLFIKEKNHTILPNYLLNVINSHTESIKKNLYL